MTGHSCATNVNSIGANGTCSTTAVAVRKTESAAIEFLVGRALGRIIGAVLANFGSRERSAENPTGVQINIILKMMKMMRLKSSINTYRSAEPVSKFRLNFCPPMVTGERYSAPLSAGVATTPPVEFESPVEAEPAAADVVEAEATLTLAEA